MNLTLYRAALGGFATGVTVITTLGKDEAPYGVTVNSFNSLSLEPPLVLWSLAKTAQSIEAFRGSGHFSVHVLTAQQEGLSNHFARSGGDKFKSLPWNRGVLGSPVFGDFASRFECRTVNQYDGGDHVIFVGEVVEFTQLKRKPLVFHQGSYAKLA